MQLRLHGGRPPAGVLDFSTPLNPLGPPPTLKRLVETIAVDASLRYPDYEYKAFKEAVSAYYGVDADRVIPLNGAAEAIQLALLALKPKHLISVEPTFGDHGYTVKSLGIQWVTVPLALEGDGYTLDPSLPCGVSRRLREGSILLLSNPNNPTGSLAPPSIIEEIADCLENGLVLLDEAFIELSPGGASLLGSAPGNVVVVRSLTKTLALPGLRVGFAHAEDARIAALLDSARQPWNVNTLAATVAVEALTTHRLEVENHVAAGLRLVESEIPWLEGRLKSIGVEVYGSHAPFILIKHEGASHPVLQAELNRRGVHVRDAGSFTYLTPQHSRVSVRSRGENQVLVEALAGALEALAERGEGI